MLQTHRSHLVIFQTTTRFSDFENVKLAYKSQYGDRTGFGYSSKENGVGIAFNIVEAYSEHALGCTLFQKKLNKIKTRDIGGGEPWTRRTINEVWKWRDATYARWMRCSNTRTTRQTISSVTVDHWKTSQSHGKRFKVWEMRTTWADWVTDGKPKAPCKILLDSVKKLF